MAQIPLPSLSLPNKPQLQSVPNIDADHIEQPRERSSWYPKELDVNNVEEEPAPAVLGKRRWSSIVLQSQNQCTIWRKRIRQTWVALHAVVQSCKLRQKVMYLDFVDSARGILID
jgi:hypothetical protein